MKPYTASIEVIDILLKNGFIEITKEKRPEHFNKLKEENYNPHKMKRAFSINGHMRNFIEFDYVTILPRHRESVRGIDMKTEISSDELKSLIAFYKLPFQTQNAMKRKGYSIFSLHRDYNSIKENPDFYKKDKSALFLVDVIENIIL